MQCSGVILDRKVWAPLRIKDPCTENRKTRHPAGFASPFLENASGQRVVMNQR